MYRATEGSLESYHARTASMHSHSCSRREKHIVSMQAGELTHVVVSSLASWSNIRARGETSGTAPEARNVIWGRLHR